MSVQEYVSSHIDAGRQPSASALVGMELPEQRPVRFTDLLFARAHLNPQDLVGFLLGHRGGRTRSALPRMRVTLRCLTPTGKPAVKIGLK